MNTIANFGSLPYGTVFILDEHQYTKNVYPGFVVSDYGSGSALSVNDEIKMVNNMELVEVLYIED